MQGPWLAGKDFACQWKRRGSLWFLHKAKREDYWLSHRCVRGLLRTYKKCPLVGRGNEEGEKGSWRENSDRTYPLEGSRSIPAQRMERLQSNHRYFRLPGISREGWENNITEKPGLSKSQQKDSRREPFLTWRRISDDATVFASQKEYNETI